MKPTDDTIALVVFLSDRSWMYGDEIAGGIARLGFERPSSQWLTSRLVAMCKEDCPRFERSKAWECPWEYRVTSWAHTALKNQWRGFRSAATTQELPTPKPEERA
ncbi:MAG TPA: hypothetical protein VI039_13110 [Solirubrobacterales bacterium]